MSSPKRHHIVPRFYLEQWKDPLKTQRPLVWVFDKQTLKTLEGSPRQPHNLLVEGHYFTEDELDGTRHAPVEEYLSHNESTIAHLLPFLEADQPVTEGHRNALWSFVLAMFVRTAWWRKPLDDLINQVYLQVPQKAKSRAEREAKNHLRQKGYNRADRRKAWQSHSKELAALVESESRPLLDQLTPLFKTKIHPSFVTAALNLEEARTYPFTLIRVEGLPLVTSDTPCVIEEDPSIFQLDRENVPGSAFICPLTPKLAFVGALGLRDSYTTFGSDWSRLFNVRIRANAKSVLVANTSAVDDTWFLTAQGLPPTMQEIIQPVLEFWRRKSSSVAKGQARGFGQR